MGLLYHLEQQTLGYCIRPVICDFEHVKNSELLIDKIVSLHRVLIDEENKKMDATEINFPAIDPIEVDILKNETGYIGTLTGG